MTTPSNMPRRVLVTLRNRDAFRELYVENEGNGAFWLGDKEARAGERLELELVFVAELMIFHIRGTVELDDPARGLRIAFDENDGKARDVILDFVRGMSDTEITRRARRFRVALPVRWADGGELQPGMTMDLSASGVSIRSDVLPTKGAAVAVELAAPDEEPFIVRSEVVWRTDEPTPSFGVMFVAGEEKTRAGIDRLLARVLEARLGRDT